MTANMMTVATAAKKWGVSKQRVRKWIAEGRVPAEEFGYQWAIPADARKPTKLAPGPKKKDAAVSP